MPSNADDDILLLDSDTDKFYTFSVASATFTLPDITGLTPVGTVIRVKNDSADGHGLLLDGNGTDTIDGNTTLAVGVGSSVLVQATTATTWDTIAAVGSAGLSPAQIGDQAFSNPPDDLTDDEKSAVRTAIGTGAFTSADETKLDGIAAGAEVNVQADWNETTTTSDAFIRNKPTISPRQAGDGLVLDSNNVDLDVNPGDGIEIALDKVAVKLDGSTLARSSSGVKLADGVARDRGTWVASTSYVVGDVVTNGGNVYRCKTANVDSTFSGQVQVGPAGRRRGERARRWSRLGAVRQ